MDLDSHTEEQVRLLTNSRNRSLLTILDEADKPLHVEELADRVVSHDVNVVSTAEYEEQVERLQLTLHHERLPELAESGLITYDPKTNKAAYRTSTTHYDKRQSESLIDALVAHLPIRQETDDESVTVLNGREAVIHHGRQLADEAQEELFCMYVSTDLLGEECIRHAENAIDRGVTFYMGSQNAEVRDLTQKHLPEATIWEPQLDWFNTPTYPRVGRLVFVDRQKVMLAILTESAEDTAPNETAFIGDGENNPLVVLVRELLGPRLDHLDYQSSDFRNELPT